MNKMSDDEEQQGLEEYFRDPNTNVVEAIKGVQHVLRKILERMDKIEEEVYFLNGMQEEEQGKKGTEQKFYSVVRGRYDEEKGDFTRDVYDNVEDYNQAVSGAWQPIAKRFNTVDEAWWHQKNTLNHARVTEARYMNSEGTFSTTWYVLWDTLTKEKRITHDVDEADNYVIGYATRFRKKHGDHTKAEIHMNALPDRNENEESS